jgi:hypothetical protein
MKYAIRRALLGIVSIPLVAGGYTFFYLSLLILGAEPTSSLTEVYGNGINIAIAIAIILTFYPQFTKLVDKFL